MSDEFLVIQRLVILHIEFADFLLRLLQKLGLFDLVFSAFSGF